jgi:hypothetical protein
MNLKKSLPVLAVALIAAYVASLGCNKVSSSSGGGSNTPLSQVANNSTVTLSSASVGSTTFTGGGPGEGLSETAPCGGCSSGFLAVAVGTNTIVVTPQGSSPVTVGTLGPFLVGNTYEVNITNGYCAQLYQRLQTNTPPNQDSTKRLIASTCP